ncbi:hypothetical protein JCM11641_007667 [Rhodosporidiobolus odoratus]
MTRPSLRSRLSTLSTRSSRSGTPLALASSAFEDETLRLPVELLLPIFSLASSSCSSAAERVSLHATLRLVNRALSVLYSRRTYRSLHLAGGEELPELVVTLKTNPELAGLLEGVELRNMVSWESRKGLEKDWKKVRATAGGVEYLQLGDKDVRGKAWDGVRGDVLHKLEGLTTLRLVSLELTYSQPPILFRRFRTPPPFSPVLPPYLRHLCLSSVSLRNVSSVSTIGSIWPDPQQCALTSLCLSDVQCADPHVSDKDAVHHIRQLLVRCAPTLKALHYSRRRSPSQAAYPGSSVLDDLPLPSLQILSISLAHFPSTLFSPHLPTPPAPNLRYLTVTLCDLLTGPRTFVPRGLASYQAFHTIEAALRPPLPTSPSTSSTSLSLSPGQKRDPFPLKVLEIHKRHRAPFMEQETTMYAKVEWRRKEVLQVAREVGVQEVRELVFEEVDVEESWRERVREVLGEKV